jgi:probable addiction module antidote protein
MTKASRFDAAEYLDSSEAMADYLSEAFETGDHSYIAQAIGTVARARGMTGIANNTGLSRESLYKSLKETGNPEFSTVMNVLDALDIQLVAKPKEKEAA